MCCRRRWCLESSLCTKGFYLSAQHKRNSPTLLSLKNQQTDAKSHVQRAHYTYCCKIHGSLHDYWCVCSSLHAPDLWPQERWSICWSICKTSPGSRRLLSRNTPRSKSEHGKTESSGTHSLLMRRKGKPVEVWKTKTRRWAHYFSFSSSETLTNIVSAHFHWAARQRVWVSTCSCTLHPTAWCVHTILHVRMCFHAWDFTWACVSMFTVLQE